MDSVIFLKTWFQHQPWIVKNAIGALMLTSLYWPVIWFIERRWGSGVRHYRTRSFLMISLTGSTIASEFTICCLRSGFSAC